MPLLNSHLQTVAASYSLLSGAIGLLLAVLSVSYTSAFASSLPPVSGDSHAETVPLIWVKATVKSGDTLYSIANKHNIKVGELHRILNSGKPAERLSRIKPGDEVRFAFSLDNSVQRVVARIDEEAILLIKRYGKIFSASTVDQPLERRIQHATGTVTHSLFHAGREAGISDAIVMSMADLFGWDIDFTLDVRTGDRFGVVYETLYRDGEYLRDGDILAAEYINRSDAYRAARYTNPLGNSDYFSPDGKTLRKAFLRSPVDFARVSSGFNLKRNHPILHSIRAHKGVDYAAAIGTPVRTTGDGKVIYRGRKGHYGRTIVLQHGSRYSTLYAHLSKYAGRVRVGSYVTQGQIIGYIGRSGLVTGAHLHYEFRADGVHHNPFKFKFPGVAPIPKQYRKDFIDKTTSLFARLDQLSGNYLVLSE